MATRTYPNASMNKPLPVEAGKGELICDGTLEHNWVVDIFGKTVCTNCHAINEVRDENH